jgi:uncharacterized protein (TIGR03545 family)
MSTDNKEKKVKGPIRTGAVIPFIVFVILVTLFNVFFLDSSIKKAIEYTGTKANGAEVNVDSVNVSISDLRIVINRIQFTNADEPMMNTFEIGKVTFQALWDGILRAKVVINEARVENIKIETKRSSKGYVIPESEKAKNSQMTKEVLANAQKDFEGNILGDIAALISGNGVKKGARVEDNLKSKKRYEELSLEVDKRSKEMDQTFKSLPNKDQLNDLKERFNGIRWKDIGHIAKAPGVIRDIDKLKKDVDKTKKKFEKANKLVNANLKFINNGQKEIKNLVKEDIESVQKRMKLPKMDSKSIAKLLFGNEALDKIKKAEEYHAMIKDYLPPKKTKEEKAAAKPDYTKHARGKGRDYQYPKSKSYPAFWLQTMVIDSENSQGKIKGKITDITNNQKTINKPTLLSVTADMVEKGIRNVKAKGLFDHRDEARDSLDLTIGEYQADKKVISESKSAKLVLKKARGNAIFNIKFVEDLVTFKVQNYYRDINYDYDADSPTMKEVLGAIAKDTKMISMSAKAQGKLSNLNWDIKTNLAKAIQKSVNNLVQAKINKAKKDIESQIQKSLGGSKKELESKLAGFKSQYQDKIDQGKSQFDGFKKEIDKKRKKEEKKARNSLEDKAKSLLKGIKF